VPDLSIEVDDLQQVLERMHAAGIPLEIWPADEPWACGASSSATRSGGC
jgi:hypothetical protein